MQNGNLPTFVQNQILKIHTVPCVSDSCSTLLQTGPCILTAGKTLSLLEKRSLLDFYDALQT